MPNARSMPSSMTIVLGELNMSYIWLLSSSLSSLSPSIGGGEIGMNYQGGRGSLGLCPFWPLCDLIYSA